MNFKLISEVIFLLFLIYQSLASNNDAYFEKSIFRALKEKNGKFTSKIRLNYTLSRVLRIREEIEEKYDFKLKNGETIIKDSSFQMKYIYINSSEVHEIYKNISCDSGLSPSRIQSLWAPRTITLHKSLNFEIIGKLKAESYPSFLNNKLNCVFFYFMKVQV